MGLFAERGAVMLTGMSSLASLAGPPVNPVFNGALDSTVAIIIPVLFLALGVQRHMYQDLLKTYYNAARDLRQRARPGTRMVPPLLITVVTGAITTFILVYGTVGEVDAILALSGRHPVGSDTPVVAAVGLAIAVAAGPASALLRAYLSAMRLLSPAGLRRPPFRERPAGGRESSGGRSKRGPEEEIGLMDRDVPADGKDSSGRRSRRRPKEEEEVGLMASEPSPL
jgi:hypothetical protein